MGIITVKDNQFLMDGKPCRIISGAMHYFRIVPQYWEDRLKKLKACGFNTVETYTCWNLHERREGQFDFSGMLDICRYIELAAQLGLNVIVRPGPYICAEWEFGGLPSWLLSYPNMCLRSSDPQYLEKVRPYYKELLSRIRPHLSTNGGNVIMMQVENEYGSYGNDKEYLAEVEKIYRENGIDCLLFTSDGPTDWMLNGGTLPHLLAVANFGSHPKENFAALRRFRQNEPLMCGEFWSGWFDHWYENHHTRTTEDIAADTTALLESGASFNFYMFHGGTNFAFYNGANYYDEYQPTITSYDYCAPLSEAGDMTPTYYKLQELFSKYTGVTPPQLEVKNSRKAAYGQLEFTQVADLIENADNLATVVRSPQPKTMEEMGQDFGYMLYTTTLRGPFTNLDLNMARVHDRANVYLNGEFAGYEERTHHKDKITLSLKEGETARLDILLENMGRINYGAKLFDRKGILEGVRLGAQFHFGWNSYSLPMENLSSLCWKSLGQHKTDRPAFYKAKFDIEGEPCDTFIEPGGFTKGFVVVNGFNIGRFYNSAGPQKTLYIPAPLLREGANEIIVFESDKAVPQAALVDVPKLG